MVSMHFFASYGTLAHIMNSTLSFLRSFFPLNTHDHIVIVGGTVRDFLQNKDNQDIDLVTDLGDTQLKALGFRSVETRSTPPIYVMHHHSFGKIEIVRLESLTDLEKDLRRRDFTLNALAMGLTGECIDPLGGRKDIETGTLRTCGRHSFVNDPLRIFRAFRFAANGFHLSGETRMLIQDQDWDTAFRTIPPERFSQEIIRALTAQKPEQFFEHLVRFNVGTHILPELFRMRDIPAGPLEYHPEGDLLTHSIQVLQRTAAQTDDPLARFCAFFHDLGKLATDIGHYPKHHRHEEAGFAIAEKFCDRLCLPARYRTALSWTSRLHGKAGKWNELRDTTKVKMAWQALQAGITEILPLISAADKPGNLPISGWNHAVRVAGMNTKELGINHEHLQTIPEKDRSSLILQKKAEALRVLLSK